MTVTSVTTNMEKVGNTISHQCNILATMPTSGHNNGKKCANENYIIKNSIPQTPPKWVSCKVQHLPIHQMKPCQLDWQKLVFLKKFILLQRNDLTCLYKVICAEPLHLFCDKECSVVIKNAKMMQIFCVTLGHVDWK